MSCRYWSRSHLDSLHFSAALRQRPGGSPLQRTSRSVSNEAAPPCMLGGVSGRWAAGRTPIVGGNQGVLPEASMLFTRRCWEGVAGHAPGARAWPWSICHVREGKREPGKLVRRMCGWVRSVTHDKGLPSFLPAIILLLTGSVDIRVYIIVTTRIFPLLSIYL